MNTFLNGLKNTANFTYTENGAITRTTTNQALLDLFALGSAYRSRSDEDCILLFKKAFEENEFYAMKCLFYIRDILEGTGERRFFRVCMNWLANVHPDVVLRNLDHFNDFGRFDDLYCLFDTKCENAMLEVIKNQISADMESYMAGPNIAISLCAKWLPSENSSSKRTTELGNKIRISLGMSHKQYRKTLSALRERINILERLMSANKWDEIDFSKIPSKAGMKYRKAFMRHDVDRKNEETYTEFMKDDTTKVNAKTLFPYECVSAVLKKLKVCSWYDWSIAINDMERLAINKYWENLGTYFNDACFNGIAVVDVSGSMHGYSAFAPINVAISLGLYCAERLNGPYANKFITFSNKPQIVNVEGVDFFDKVERMSKAGWDMNTNIEAVFNLLLTIAKNNYCSQEEIPENIIIISDMEFDDAVSTKHYTTDTLMEGIKKEWAAYGYKLPKLTFWNVDARQNNIPMRDDGNIRYVSGMSQNIFDSIMKNLDATDLMMDKLNSERYSCIH